MSGRGSKVGRTGKRGISIGLKRKEKLGKTKRRPTVPLNKGAQLKHEKVINKTFGPPKHEASGSILAHLFAGVEMKPLCMDYAVPWRTPIRLVSLLTLGLGFLQLLICGYTYVYVPNELYGAWWAAPPIITAGFFGVLALNRGFVVTSCVMSVLGFLCNLPAIIFYDAGYMNQLGGLQTCVELLPYPNPGINKEFGNTGGSLPGIAARCADEAMSPSIACYCSNGINLDESGGYCMNFGTVHEGDCDLILKDFTQLVAMGVVVESMTTAVLALHICVTGMVLFCLNKHPTPAELKEMEREGHEYAGGLFHYSEEFGANTTSHHVDGAYYNERGVLMTGERNRGRSDYEDDHYSDYSDGGSIEPFEYDPESGGYWDDDGDFHYGFFDDDGTWVETDEDGYELDEDLQYEEEQDRRKRRGSRARR